jgi:hypothetical protein
MLSMILGCCVWLVLGERFPVGDEQKWPTLNNIVCYGLILLVPVYLTFFFYF